MTPCKGAALRVVRSELATLPVLSFSGEKVAPHGLYPDPRRGARRRQEALPPKEDGACPPRLPAHPAPARRRRRLRPQARDWSVKINRKEKRLAISTALASAAANALVVEDFEDQFAGGPRPRTSSRPCADGGSTPSRRMEVGSKRREAGSDRSGGRRGGNEAAGSGEGIEEAGSGRGIEGKIKWEWEAE
uniref:Uncharacterized protein n=1 Tax=Ananas comosus var. bracteatus TaxID=296719 RepID=A0A6V7NH65_ANACO|nr:unnamed protein product [Ananas comosus var. bracteatus]